LTAMAPAFLNSLLPTSIRQIGNWVLYGCLDHAQASRDERRWFEASARTVDCSKSSASATTASSPRKPFTDQGPVERAGQRAFGPRFADPRRTTGLELEPADRCLSRRETEVRFAADSPLEGAGFEPSVPGERAGGLLSKPGKLSDALRPQRWVTQVGRSSFRHAPVTSLSTFDAELARV
jgi:hypothetical protein